MMKSVILVFIILGLTEATVDENDLNVQEPSDDPAIDDSSPNWLPFDNMNSALKGYDTFDSKFVSNYYFQPYSGTSL